MQHPLPTCIVLCEYTTLNMDMSLHKQLTVYFQKCLTVYTYKQYETKIKCYIQNLGVLQGNHMSFLNFPPPKKYNNNNNNNNNN